MSGESQRVRREPAGFDPGALVGGRYRVIGRLGAGGMATVYRVVDVSNGCTLALKRHGGGNAPRDRERQALRFRHEFHTMAGLRHPRIVRVFDFGVLRQVAFYTMELLDGSDFRELGPVDAAKACPLLRDVASALAFLHARRLIHRDLAPRNVRCTADGRAKLIDFGVLATVGVCGDVAGTPPLIAPENVRGLPLDHRADLYGLGGLAYWLLTGRYAYFARDIEELDKAWEKRPPPPSMLAEGIPKELDELVMSLLSLDPLGRPRAAAEVIDRLGAIGKLPPIEEAQVTRGYLASAVIVGRERELEVLGRLVTKAHQGSGGAVVVEAPSGGGKSRLLRELRLAAQLAGATVLVAGSESAGKGPYGVMRALARALIAAAPREAIDRARPRATVIARVVTELCQHLGRITLASIEGDPAEHRLRIQNELVQWFLEVAQDRTLILVVDDVQRTDEASAAVLAALAHAARGPRLLVAVALRTDEPAIAAAAVGSVRDAAVRVRLRGLSAEHVEQLVRGVFGDVPHLDRLATWIHKVADGSPLYCMELARHVVDEGIVRCIDGIWTIPEDLSARGVPTLLSEAMEARVRELSPRARALGEALSVHGGELPLALCTELGGGVEGDAFAALDELLYGEVLIGSGEAYRFRHDGPREALLRGLDDGRKKVLHLKIGEWLAASAEVGSERDEEVGWHLLRGGERVRGAQLLARAGTRLYEAQSFSDSTAALEAALEVWEQEGRAPKDTLALRHMLVMVGCLGDRRMAVRYANETLRAIARYAGIGFAAKLGPVVGRALAFFLGIVLAFVRTLFTPLGRRGPWPMRATQLFYVEQTYVAVFRSFSFELDELREHISSLAPLEVFRRRLPYGATIFARSALMMPLGRYGTVLAQADQILDVLEHDRLFPIDDMDRKSAEGGAYYMQAMVASLRLDPSIEQRQKLRGLNLKFFEVSENICRLTYHRFRGEEDEAQAIQTRTELLLVQLGAMWAPEAHMQWLSGLAYGLTRDVLGLRRQVEELSRLLKYGVRVEGLLETARGEYLRERGDLEGAVERFERALTVLDREESLVRLATLTGLAEAHLAAHQVEAAVRRAQEALRILEDPDRDIVTWRARAERVLALAEAARGAVVAGCVRLDRMLDLVAPLRAPSLLGTLHEARARLAIVAGDEAAASLHTRAMESWFRSSKNPVLIARIERLADARARQDAKHPAPAAGSVETLAASPGALSSSTAGDRATLLDDAVTLSRVDAPHAWVSAVLSGCRGRTERATRALDLLMNGGRGGYLFLVHDDELELTAPLSGDEPPTKLVEALAQAQPAAGRSATEDDALCTTDDGVAWHAVWLVALRGSARVVVGAVAFNETAPYPAHGLVDRIAHELYMAGDVSTAGPAFAIA